MNASTDKLKLELTLSPIDAAMLRASLRRDATGRDALGIKRPDALAQSALAAVCRAIVKGGYRPTVLNTTLLDGELPLGLELPANDIRLEFSTREAA